MCSTDEQQWQESESYGASVLQEAPHLRQLLPTLDGARHDTLREMQPGAREVPEIAPAPELRARCQRGRLRAVPQASPDCHQQAVPEVPRSPRQPEATEQMKDTPPDRTPFRLSRLFHWPTVSSRLPELRRQLPANPQRDCQLVPPIRKINDSSQSQLSRITDTFLGDN